MKITKIAQFEDEGFDSEEQISAKEQFEAQQELEKEEQERSVGKRGLTYNAKVLMSLRDVLGEPLQASWVSNGAVGWFDVDGIIYEISVAPAAYGNYFGYFKELQARDKKPETESQENLPM